MKRYLLIALLAFPVAAQDGKTTWTRAEMQELVGKLQAYREKERAQFVNELRELDSINRELQRKVDTLTARTVCS